MLFNDVVGQNEVKQHLTEMVKNNRLSHALLFLAKEGTGGLPLALAFAQYVVCEKVNRRTPAPAPSLFGFEEPVPAVPADIPADACGVCPACQKAAQLIHPDIHFSFPVISKKSGDKPKSADWVAEWREFVKQQPYGNVYQWLQFIGAENKQGNITAEECNEIMRLLSLKSFESEYKILVMWMPEYLGLQGNKLLKLVEEPPPNTLFLFIAEKEEQILQTILSRTQLVKIPWVATADIEQALVDRYDTPAHRAKQLAHISEGSYLEAINLLQHAEEDWLTQLRQWLNATLKGGPAGQVKWVDEISKLGREKQKQFLQYFNHVLEQCIRLRIMGAEFVNLSENETELAQRLNKITGVTQQQTIISELDNATYYIERNANAKMLFMALTIKLQHIIEDKVLTSAT